MGLVRWEEETGSNQKPEGTYCQQAKHARPRLCASAFLAAHSTTAAACLGSLFIHLFSFAGGTRRLFSTSLAIPTGASLGGALSSVFAPRRCLLFSFL